MTSKTRKILFLFFLAFFLALAPILVFYSQGYRLNIPFSNGKIFVKTGGLFLKATPKQSEVYINGKFVKKTDYFFGSCLIEDLMPRKYKIEVKKEGYNTWEKNLEIKEKTVTEVKTITLIPSNPQFTVLTKEIENYWPSPDGKKIVFYEKNAEGWQLKLYDNEKDLKSHLISENDVYLDGADLVSLEWSKDSKEIYFSASFREQERAFTLNIEKTPPRLSKKEESIIIPENAITYFKNDEALYYLETSGFIERKDFESGFLTKINQKPLDKIEEAEYRLWVFKDRLFLKEGKALYAYNPSLGGFERIFDGLESDLQISPDSGKIAYFSNSEIWVLYLQEKNDPPAKKSGEKLFIARMSEKIQSCFWLNSDYLIFSNGGKIQVAEIDERDKINITNFAKFSDSATEQNGQQVMYWNSDAKLFFILNNGSLYQSQIN